MWSSQGGVFVTKKPAMEVTEPAVTFSPLASQSPAKDSIANAYTLESATEIAYPSSDSTPRESTGS